MLAKTKTRKKTHKTVENELMNSLRENEVVEGPVLYIAK